MRKFTPGIVITLCFLAWGVSQLPEYGITIDEPLHHASGEINVMQFIGPTDMIENYHNLRYYGPVSDMIGHISFSVLWGMTGLFNPVDARHVHLLFFFCGSIFLIYWIALRWWNMQAAVASTLLFALTPRILGHSFNNPKSIPLIFWSLILLICFDYWRVAGRLRYALYAGCAAGLGFATKIDVVFLMVAIVGRQIVQSLTEAQKSQKHHPRLSIHYGGFFGSFVLTVLATWPWLRAAPIQRFIELVEFYVHHPKTGMVFYAGEWFGIGKAPWHYGPVYFILTTPILILALALVGFAWNLIPKAPKDPMIPMLGIWFLAGAAPRCLPGAVIYDGPRHFLFLYPALALAAGFALNQLCKRMSQTTWPGYCVVGACALYLILVNGAYHPFQTSYYNCLTGGIQGAEGRYEISSWGHSLRHAARKVNALAPPNSSVHVHYPRGLVKYYLRPDLTESPADPAVLITSSFRLPPDHAKLPAPDDTISVQGVILNRIYLKKPALAQK